MDCPINHQKELSRIAIGTAQFGLNYGISNTRGQTTLKQAEEILNTAARCGINTIDTAKLYGNSESTLGQLETAEFKLITKLPPLPEHQDNVFNWVEQQLQDSITKMGCAKLHGVLLHDPSQLHSPAGQDIASSLIKLKEAGVIDKVGVSIYNPEDLTIYSSVLPLDLVQCPFNILDRRLETSGWMAQLSQRNVEIHTRSCFLQGLLLMPESQRPTYFDTWSSLFETWDNWLKENNLSPLQACLRFVLSFPEISKAVVGIETASQFEQVIESCIGKIPTIPDHLRSDDFELINPSHWKS